jgi:hypothetical protein
MWTDFDSICRKCSKGEVVNEIALNRCTTMMATVTTLRNWQCPGAAANATFQEMMKAATFRREANKMKIIGVKEHKTGRAGSARLNLKPRIGRECRSMCSTSGHFNILNSKVT